MKKTIVFLEKSNFSTSAIKKLEIEYNIADIIDVKNKSKVEKENVVAIFTRLGSYIDESICAAYPRLRWILTPTTGLNHISEDLIKTRKINVISLKGERNFLDGITATAELTWGLLLSLVRNIPSASVHVDEGGWDRDRFCGVSLSGKTIGIVGYGRIGTMVEEYAHAFRMKVLVSDIKPRVPKHGTLVDLDILLQMSDVVTLHVDYSEDIKNFFDMNKFNKMKKNAFFINTSRGELVDEDAMIFALKGELIKGAAVDVVSEENSEKRIEKLALWKREVGNKILVVPHIGGATSDAMRMTEEFVVDKFLSVQCPHRNCLSDCTFSTK